MPDIDYEMVNWEDEPSTQTSVSRRNLNKMDKAIYDMAKYLNKSKTYILETSSWIGSGSDIYKYMLQISTTDYTDNDMPICQVYGINDIETQDEITSIGYIKKIIVNNSGILVYATSKPISNLKLILKM